jgi:hypothetical protein
VCHPYPFSREDEQEGDDTGVTDKPVVGVVTCMAEKKFTFLEVHLGDGEIQFGPKSIETGTRGERASDEGDEYDDEASESSGGLRLLPVVLGLLVLVGAAFAAKKFVGSDMDDLEELDEVMTEP